MYFGFENITVEYGKRRILENLSLEIPKGKITALIGKNGCGKSTLLKTVFRTVKPSVGQVILEDRPLVSYPRRTLARRIAGLSQLRTSIPEIDVRTLVSYGRYPHLSFAQRMRGEDWDITDNALCLTGMKEAAHRLLTHLSGGELQRAWIAMNIAQQAEIMILDEPAAYLDIGCQDEIMELLFRLSREKGVTVLVVLHDLNMAARFCDRIAVMRDRTVYRCGAPGEILTAEILREVFGLEAKILWDADNRCPYFASIPKTRTLEIY